MDTAAYEKLLSELEIPSEWNAEDKEALLDKKYAEALELLDVAQQNGEEDRITQLDDRIKKMEEALEYTKEIKKRLSSGLVLNTQSDKDRLEELKETGKKEEAQKVKQFAAASQSAANTPVPQPSISSNNVNSLLKSQMRRAGMELEDENWSQARRLYNDILKAEPENAEANLGLFMAIQQICEERDIPEAAKKAMENNKDIFQEKQFLLARRYADDSMKKELANYEKGRDYLIAIEALRKAGTNEDYRNVSEMFDKLGDYKDAPRKKKECDQHWQKSLYDSTIQAMKKARDKDEFAAVINNFDKLGDYEDAGEQRKQAAYLGAVRLLQNAKDTKDVSGFSAAKKMFEELGDYSDSKEKIKECEEGIEQLPKQLQRQLESYGKYKQEYKDFEEHFTNREEIRRYESKIRSQQARIDSLKKKRTGSPIPKRWIFLAGGLCLLCYFVSVVAKWSKPVLEVFIEIGVEFLSIFVDGDSPDYVLELLDYYKAESKILGIIFMSIFVIAFVYWVRHQLKAEYDDLMPALMKGFLKAVLTSMIMIIILSLISRLCIFADEKFRKQAHFIGTVALILVIAMTVQRILIMKNFRTAEVRRLKRLIVDDYMNIEKIIGMEYQKIYDRYPDAGPERKAVSEVQRLLMDNIKKRNGGG